MEISHNSSPRSRSRSPFKSPHQPGGDTASTPLRPTAAPLPWFTESYFTSEPATAAARKKYIIFLTLKIAFLICFLMAVLSIYWGSLWQTPQHTYNLNNWVVDFDGGAVGQFISSAVVDSGGASTALTWTVVSPDLFPNGAPDLENEVVQEQVWTIIAINKNVTNALNAAVATANDSYIADDSISVYVAEARNENAYRVVIHPTVLTLLDGITESFNAEYISEIPARSSNATALFVNAPRLISQPISYTINNVRPFDVPVATAVDFVGLIYLLILGFVVTMEHYAARIMVSHLDDRLTFKWLIIIRIVNPIIMYFFVSLFYSLLSLAFQVPFNRFYGGAGFVIYWMMSWLAMCALGGAVESMITILTPQFIPFFLLLWIIANVSVSVYPIPLLAAVYRYGYAMPFYNDQQTIRAIVFGTRNQMGLNFGVQIAWIFISWCTLIVFQLIMRHRAVRAHNAAIADAAGESLSEKQGP